MVMSNTRVNQRLNSFYEEFTSVDAILRALSRDRQEEGMVTAADLYTRSLDCQNQGGFALLEHHAALVAEYKALGEGQRVLDAGCGLGGPGRYLADRFGCAVTGIDVLPARVQAASTLTRMVGLGDRVAYCQVDATRLPFSAHRFEQVWMLDVSIHIANKAALFGELARVVHIGGLLVLHDQMGPLPPAMRPITRRAPYIAPALPQLLRYVEGAGLRVLTWRDTTDTVLTYMQGRRADLLQGVERGTRAARSRRQRRLAMITAYIEALDHQGSRTGILIARRPA
jgi:cyclopropane fatty-acyl-phospholipid synthase-like methyltransferase